MAGRDREHRKGKKRCCEKPPHKACKACPRRRSGGRPDAQPRAPADGDDLQACPLAAWRLA